MSFAEKIGGLFMLLLVSACTQQPDTLFRSVPADESDIAFENTIIESDSLNMLDYEYAYSGGGIAVADFNNDGLQDLYFVGNAVSNRLYLNEGNMKFRDVTEPANAGSSNAWHTGVSAVDINNDGWTDLYLSVAKNENPEKRKNILLIHQGLNEQGIPAFINRAEAYGLASTSFSTKSAFFDYDNDGDLDMYEMVADKRRKGRQNMEMSDSKRRRANTDRLFRNDGGAARGHPYFTDVSEGAGIRKSGYGLGLNIVDINRDGWQDIYVGNDFVSNDLLWINNGDGTFTDRAGSYFKHTSFSAMGTDIGDINNDGLMDVVALDMAGSNNRQKQTMFSPNNYQNYFNNIFKDFDPQYTRNTLQLNQGEARGEQRPVFSEIALLSGMAETDWSWGVVMADLNNDRFEDLVITNGIPRNKIDKDFVRFRNQMSSIAPKSMLLDSIPHDKSRNVSFQNNGDLTFANTSEAWGLGERGYSTGLVWADLDNDGDLDIVMSNINDRPFIYENTLDSRDENHHWLKVEFSGPEQNRTGIGAVVSVFDESGLRTKVNQPFRSYLSTVENGVHIGLGPAPKVDSVVVYWPVEDKKQTWKEVRANQTLRADYADAREMHSPRNKRPSSPLFEEVTAKTGITYRHEEQNYMDFKVQRMLPYKLSQYGPALAVGDINGDGLDDLFIGGALTHRGAILMQQEDGRFEEQAFHPENMEKNGAIQEDAGVLLFDADGDGDKDLYVVSGSVENRPESSAYQDRFYENRGNGQFLLRKEALPSFNLSGSAVKAADYDRDGDLDLFIGGRSLPRFYPMPVSSVILRNDSRDGKIVFTDVSSAVAPSLNELGRVTDALWSDFNGDGWQDLVIAGEWMPVTFLVNNEGTFENITERTGIAGEVGWWNSLVGGDFDQDGDTDYVAGNMGLNTIYKASVEEPVRIYGNDFDGNGAYDAILTLYNADTLGNRKEYPAHKFEDFHWQLPRRTQQISSIEHYATSTIKDLFSPSELEEALRYEATELRTGYIENKGGGTFEWRPLPVEAQFAPVFGMLAEDLTGDGKLDLLMSGNHFGGEAQVGSYDAFNGLLLQGGGNGRFEPVPVSKSGVFIPADGKSLVKLRTAADEYLVAASQNQGPLLLFKHKTERKLFRAGPDDAYAILEFKDGSREKREFYYGSSFQSASGRFIRIAEDVTSLTVVTYDNRKRTIAY